MGNDITKSLLEFIDKSPTCFHVVKNIEEILEKNGFERLLENDDWKLKKAGKYYVIRKDSSIIAFVVPKKNFTRVNIAAAHSDFPSFKLKPNPVMESARAYASLNTEKYGGMLMATWFDRPLSIAGRVFVKTKKGLESRLVNVDRDLAMIPSVAIHMNRDANDGYKYNAQVDTIPLFGMGSDLDAVDSIIANELKLKPEQIMGRDLFLCIRQKGCIWGEKEEFISSRGLDDLQCVFANLQGLINAKPSQDKLALCCVFDNEEVGSLTAQGADSTFLEDTLYRINEALSFNKTHLLKAISEGFMISADNAHAVHPNHPEYADPTNRPYLNGGIVLKFNAAQKYTTDGESEAIFRELCEAARVPVQTFTNRSNMPGGSTLGNLSNGHVSIRSVDIGLPQLAMHSAYETAGAKDTEYLVELMKLYFS